MRIYLRVCAVVSGLLVLGFLLPAGLGQSPKGEPRPPTKAPAKPPLTLKVFKLERASPEVIIDAMNSLLEAPDMEIGAPPLPPDVALPAGRAGIGGIGGAGIGGAGALGFGGFGGIGGMGENVIPVWRAAVDERTRAVIVRGSPRHLLVAADLVAVLDRRANTPLPPLQVIKAYALKYASASELVTVIDQLAFNDLRSSSPDENLLVVIGPDEATNAIAELVKELDLPTKGDPEPKKEKSPDPKKKPEPKKEK